MFAATDVENVTPCCFFTYSRVTYTHVAGDNTYMEFHAITYVLLRTTDIHKQLLLWRFVVHSNIELTRRYSPQLCVRTCVSTLPWVWK